MGNIKIDNYVVGMVKTNCYVVANATTKECIVIDPGAAPRQLAERVRQDGLTLVAILLTHGHFDHVAAAESMGKEFDVKVYAHEAEAETLRDADKNASWMLGAHETYDADVFLKDGEVLHLAGFEIKVLHTPGHTVGGCCYYIPEEAVLFSGDTLFAQSVGRTDLEGGSMSQLVRSIREKLLILTEEAVGVDSNSETKHDITVYPGHNEVTTIETERKYNPYL